MDEQAIQAFWQANPCGEQLVSQSFSASAAENFFAEYDRFRYALEAHIPACLDALNVQDKNILEIGLGQGADSEQLIRRGARWSGIDLTQAAVDRVTLRCQLRKLPIVSCKSGSVLDLPWPDETFDIVYSHGVLHHVPNIARAQQEIARVLRPGGRLIVMLYAKHSINYWIAICVCRRLGLIAMRSLGIQGDGIYRRHYQLSRQMGLLQYLKMDNFIHRSTDGPDNAYSKVYTRKEIDKDFPGFQVRRTFKRFMYAPPLPVKGLPGQSAMGWHLWAEMVRK